MASIIETVCPENRFHKFDDCVSSFPGYYFLETVPLISPEPDRVIGTVHKEASAAVSSAHKSPICFVQLAGTIHLVEEASRKLSTGGYFDQHYSDLLPPLLPFSIFFKVPPD